MKCELAGALVHGPKVLFLDEPTIGLDVSMQVAMRDFIRQYNEQHGATLILTSHYMDDVAALCPRVIVIDKGALSFDGKLDDLVQARAAREAAHLALLAAGLARAGRGAGHGGEARARRGRCSRCRRAR